MALKVFSRSHGFLTCFRANFRSDLRFLQGNGIFAKTSAFSACPTYFQRVFLSAKTFRCFQRKTTVRTDSERKKPKKPEGTEPSAAFAVRPSVFGFCSDLSNVFPNLRSPSKLSPSFRRFFSFSTGFFEFSQAPCPKVGAAGSLSAFYAVLRVFTPPLKKLPCPSLKLRFKLFSAPHREFSFLAACLSV